MGKQGFVGWIRGHIADCSFSIFLWAIGMTQEQYFEEVIANADIILPAARRT